MAGTGLLPLAPPHASAAGTGIQEPAVVRTGSHLGSLYPFVQGQADRSPLELSFLRPEFNSLQQWQPLARARIFEHLFYAPPRVAPQPQLVRRTDKGDYVEEYLDLPDDGGSPCAGVRAGAQEGSSAGAGHRRAAQS